MTKAPAAQLSLFGDAPSSAASFGVRAAPPSAAALALAAALPPEVRLGTSSWSFPGWRGLVYDAEYGERVLAQEGLRAYAQHPLFGTVGVDRTYYAPIGAEVFAAYAEMVPSTFRFLVKAHEDTVVARFPQHPRYGVRAGERNARFLDPSYALDAVVGPASAGLGEKLGVVLFQAPPQDVAAMGGPGRFATLLQRFLEEMPPGVPVAVELRNQRLWTPDVLDVLSETGATPCFAHHPALEAIDAQRSRFARFTDRPLVVRWMLRRGLKYEAAKRRYAPFNALVDRDDTARDAIVAAVREAALAQRSVMVIVNNKAEGCSPRSVERLAEALVGGT
jgi:uncharacterized protein YecE (DUF72 family)